jgi:hypothetical protein
LRCRFFTTHPNLSPERLAHLTDVYGNDRVTLVADAGNRLVAVSRYERQPDGENARVELVVDDPVREDDIEVRLLERLAAIANRVGIRRLLLNVSPLDRPLIDTLDNSAFDLRRRLHCGIVTITLRLDPDA